MGDESIQDIQLTASSWLQQYPPSSGRPFFPGWCSHASDKNPHITVRKMFIKCADIFQLIYTYGNFIKFKG